MNRLSKTASEDTAETSTWIAVGQHIDRTALKRTAEVLRARWAGRYDFRISESAQAKGEWELHLRHR